MPAGRSAKRGALFVLPHYIPLPQVNYEPFTANAYKRHLTSLYGKTNTQTRSGLVALFFKDE